MAVTKKTEEVKAAAAKAEVKAAPKAAAKVAAPKAEVKAAPKAEKKAAAPKAEKKPAAKKPAAKKAAAKKPAAKKAEANVVVEYYGKQFVTKDIVAACEKAYKAENKAAVKTIDVYVKPEDNAAYYVVNSKVAGKVDL